MALRTLIVDDEPLAVERLRGLLEEITDVDVVAAASGCTTAIEAVKRHAPDLILLDIRMRDGTAFDLLNMLPADMAPMVAFSTAYPRYATQAFDVNAFDFLLKPVDPARLKQLVTRALRQKHLLSFEDRARELERVVFQLREAEVDQAPRYESEIWIRSKGTEHVRVPIASIVRVAALDDYVSIQTLSGSEHLLRATLENVEGVLDPEVFTRIHRSSIVRKELIAKIISHRTGARSAVMTDGTILPIGRTFWKRLNWNSPQASK